MVFHFIYMSQTPTGRYYIGRHSTSNINDNYKGSGLWVRSIKDKSTLTRIILEFCDSFEQLKEREAAIIAEHLGKPLCMNFNNSSCGFPSGELNPAKTPEERAKRRDRFLGEHNPMNYKEYREKAGAAKRGRPSRNKGVPASEQTRQNISKGRTGIKISEEGRRKLSESRLRDYATGVRTPNKGMLGKKHTEERNARASELALNRDRIPCEHCGTEVTKQNHILWHGDKCKQNPNKTGASNTERNNKIAQSNQRKRAKRFGVEDLTEIYADMRAMYNQGCMIKEIAEKYNYYGAGIREVVVSVVKKDVGI